MNKKVTVEKLDSVSEKFQAGIPVSWALNFILGEGLAIRFLQQQLAEGARPLDKDFETTDEQRVCKSTIILGYMLNKLGIFTIEDRARVVAETGDGDYGNIKAVLENVYQQLDVAHDLEVADFGTLVDKIPAAATVH